MFGYLLAIARSQTGAWSWLLHRVTGVGVLVFLIFHIIDTALIGLGPEAYEQFLARLKTPLFLALDTVAFLFVLFHAITWFNLTPKAIVLRLRGKRVPDWLILGLNYAAWLVLSGAVAFVLLRE